jgi:hypothetical protein
MELLDGDGALDQDMGGTADQDARPVGPDMDAPGAAHPGALAHDQRIGQPPFGAQPAAIAALSDPVIGSSRIPLDGARLRTS